MLDPFNTPITIVLLSTPFQYHLANQQAWRPSWSTPVKSEQLTLAVRWPDQPPNLQPQAARVIDAQSSTALFRALETALFSSVHQ